MLDFSLNISSFYLQKLAINSVYPDFVQKFNTAVSSISSFLNIQASNYQIISNNYLKNFIEKHNLHLINALSPNGCLAAIKRQIQRQPNVILNLNVIPFYFKIDLKNINAKATVLPISNTKSIIWSNLIEYPQEIDEFDSLAAQYFSIALIYRQTTDHLQDFKQNIETSFKHITVNCQNSNPAYFITVLRLDSAAKAIKLQQALYIENILVSTTENLVQILLKPWHTGADVEILKKFIGQKLEKL